MAKHNWEFVSSIIDLALDLSPEERFSFIQKQCIGKPDAEKEVLTFFKNIDASDIFWNELFVSGNNLAQEMTISGGEINLDEIFEPLQQAGPYRIIRLIARGGMGNVYLAERSDGQFKRTAAVKILKHELSSSNHTGRFLQEREILSSLEHPNIARLYDGGLTSDKRPYLVMEYVNGVPITNYCNEKSCTLIQKLDLFKQVCSAVEYAHRNLIVHRDLKPDNILVKPDGMVKILDFGIAKIIDTELSPEMLVQTVENTHMLSIRYAAPEQVTLEKITTSTDVYALGLLLYEMITGHPPFDLQGKKLREAEKIICDELPHKPSSRITDPRLAKKIRGDIDAIVLKALRKDPMRRYITVAQFMEDINRYTNGSPVSAHKESWFYITKKFAARYPAAIITAFLIILGFWGYLFTLQQHSVLVSAERDRAESEAQRSGIITEFLMNLFESADPVHSSGEELSVRDLLEQGLEQIDQLSGQPEIQSVLSMTMARTYHTLGYYENAISLMDRVLHNLKHSGSSDLLLAETLTEKGELLRHSGRYSEAELLYREALDIQENLIGKEHQEYAKTLNYLAITLRYQGRYDEAEMLYLEALKIRKHILGPAHHDVASTLNNLGVLYSNQGKYSESETFHTEALKIRRDQMGDGHPDVAQSLYNLAVVYRNLGNYAEAAKYNQKALEIEQQVFGADHPTTLITMNNLGILYRIMGDYKNAEITYRSVLEARQRVLGENHPQTFTSLNNLGSILRRQGNLTEAESLTRTALEKRKAMLGDVHPHVAFSMNTLGILLMDKGEYEEAELYLLNAIEITQNIYGEEHPSIATYMTNLGLLYRNMGNYDDAGKIYLNALKMRKKLLGSEHPNVAVTMFRLGLLYQELGDYTLAITYLQGAYDIQTAVFEADHPELMKTKEKLDAIQSAMAHTE